MSCYPREGAMSKTLEEMIRNPRISNAVKIDRPCNEEYYRLCREKGNSEIQEIMRGYDLARIEAANIYVRG